MQEVSECYCRFRELMDVIDELPMEFAKPGPQQAKFEMTGSGRTGQETAEHEEAERDLVEKLCGKVEHAMAENEKAWRERSKHEQGTYGEGLQGRQRWPA